MVKKQRKVRPRQRSWLAPRTTTRMKSWPRSTPRRSKDQVSRSSVSCASVSVRSTCPSWNPVRSMFSRSTRATCSSTSIKTRVLVRMLRFTRRWAERCPRDCAYWTKPPQPTKTPMSSPLLSLPNTLSVQLVTWRTLDRSLLAATLSLRRVRMGRRDWNRNTV